MARIANPYRFAKPLLLVVAAGFMATAMGCAHHPGQGHHASHHSEVQSAEATIKVVGADRLAEEMGIELITLRTTAGGHMLDLRYRVVNSEKALQVLRMKSKVEVTVVDTVQDVVAQVPETMLGKLRGKQAVAHPDKVYYVIFGNPQQRILPGSTVEVRFGDIVVHNWPVL